MSTLDVARSLLGVRPSTKDEQPFRVYGPRDVVTLPKADLDKSADGNVRALRIAFALLAKKLTAAEREQLARLDQQKALRASALHEIAEEIILKEIEECENYLRGLEGKAA